MGVICTGDFGCRLDPDAHSSYEDAVKRFTETADIGLHQLSVQ